MLTHLMKILSDTNSNHHVMNKALRISSTKPFTSCGCIVSCRFEHKVNDMLS
jgi:hypothetical protein